MVSSLAILAPKKGVPHKVLPSKTSQLKQLKYSQSQLFPKQNCLTNANLIELKSNQNRLFPNQNWFETPRLLVSTARSQVPVHICMWRNNPPRCPLIFALCSGGSFGFLILCFLFVRMFFDVCFLMLQNG